jgi:hypothetical protein
MKRLLFSFLLALFAAPITRAAEVRAAEVLVLCYHDVRDDVQGNPLQTIPEVGQFPRVTPGIVTPTSMRRVRGIWRQTSTG